MSNKNFLHVVHLEIFFLINFWLSMRRTVFSSRFSALSGLQLCTETNVLYYSGGYRRWYPLDSGTFGVWRPPWDSRDPCVYSPLIFIMYVYCIMYILYNRGWAGVSTEPPWPVWQYRKSCWTPCTWNRAPILNCKLWGILKSLLLDLRTILESWTSLHRTKLWL